MLRGAVLLQCLCNSVMLYFDVPQKLFFLNLVTPDLSYIISFNYNKVKSACLFQTKCEKFCHKLNLIILLVLLDLNVHDGLLFSTIPAKRAAPMVNNFFLQPAVRVRV